MVADQLQASFVKLYWEQVRHDVFLANPSLCKLIDKISPSKKFPLIKATYPFGSLIINKGKLSDDYCKTDIDVRLIQSALKYATIPLGLLLDNSSEAFVQLDNRTVPLNVLNKGAFFGNFELMNSFAGKDVEQPWSVSAGLRSIFFLQKISNNMGQQRLKKAFGLTTQAPQNFNEQWQIFVDLANADNNNHWETNILFFTEPWFDRKLTDSSDWYKFREHLYLESWKQRHHLIEQPITSSLWQVFSSAIQNRKLRPSPYILDTIKYLLLISQTVSPAFKPIEAEYYAPLKTIRDAYYNFYKLNIANYYPTIMGPGFLNASTDFLYYSLNYPTLYEGHYEKGQCNFIVELREVKLALDTLYKYLDLHENSITREIVDSIKNLHFDYFHRSQDNDKELLNSGQIIIDDKSFIEANSCYSNKFCNKSPFFSGCVRISRNRNEQ